MRTIPLSGIKKIEELAAQTKDCISLSQGALRAGGIPTEIKKHLQTLLETSCTDYYGSSAGLYALREALAEYHSSEKVKVSPRSILPTHGSIGALSLVFLALLKAGDEVLIPEPAYPAYYTLSLAVGAQPVFVSLFEKAAAPVDWQLSLDSLEKRVTEKTKILVFSNPWNPLGIIVPEKQIAELIEWCSQKKIYLIVDEAYRDYTFDHSATYFTSAVSHAIANEYVITTQSFSKHFAMSGWRVGYLVAREALVQSCITIQDALLNSLNNTAQYAALYATQHPELITPFKKLVQEHALITQTALEPLIKRELIATRIPDGGFFYFIQVRQEPVDLCMRLLTHGGVSLVPGPSFGPSGKNFIRLCFARERAVLETGLDRFVSYMLKDDHV